MPLLCRSPVSAHEERTTGRRQRLAARQAPGSRYHRWPRCPARARRARLWRGSWTDSLGNKLRAVETRLVELEKIIERLEAAALTTARVRRDFRALGHGYRAMCRAE